VRTIALALVVCGAVAIDIATIRLRRPFISEARAVSRPIQVADDGYASSQACRACHPSEYETWHESFHRTMTQVPTGDNVRADFDGVTIAAGPGTQMRLQHGSDGRLWAEFDDPDVNVVNVVNVATVVTGAADAVPDASGPPPRVNRPIVLITGSHQQQVYWYGTERGRLLGQLPAMFLIAERRWIPRRAAFMRPPTDGAASETGRWNGVCINCHATHGKWRFDTPIPPRLSDASTAGTTAAEFGIACEACHGPGADHVRLNGNPVRRYRLHLSGRPDRSIVNPVHIDARRSSQTCGQCHAVWNFYERDDELSVNGVGFSYRPGDDLERTRFVLKPATNAASPAAQRVLARDPNLERDSFWSDGMIRVSGREYNGLVESPCYKNADDDRKMSCFSCHSMHKAPGDPQSVTKWADTHQVADGLDGNRACLQCHAAIGANLTAHTKHAAGSQGSSCYNCHMPYTTYGLLRALRSHQVSSPTVTASVQTGRPNACNLCHLDKTLAWAAERLTTWYSSPTASLRPLGSLTDDERTIAASLLWLLRGDAGQRALVAWSMGWAPAQQVSGTDWTVPYLSALLDDPYDAVRIIASRSLRSLPGFPAFTYDFLAPSTERVASVAGILDAWQRGRRPAGMRTDRALLFNADGSLNGDVVNRLLRQRDNRRVSLRE
jgi:hypothetical protein